MTCYLRGPEHPKWSSRPTYTAAHQRVKAASGSASLRTCVDCGGKAEHWAYDRQDPDELSGVDYHGSHLTYSGKPQHYQPKCRRCHLGGDAARRRRERAA
jgi:hypothetical protein